jgi:hypothetical protein
MATERTKRIVELMKHEIDLCRAGKKDDGLIEEIKRTKAELERLEDSQYHIPAHLDCGLVTIESKIYSESIVSGEPVIDEDEVETWVDRQVQVWLYQQQRQDEIDQLKKKIAEMVEKKKKMDHDLCNPSESMRMICREVTALAQERGFRGQ